MRRYIITLGIISWIFITQLNAQSDSTVGQASLQKIKKSQQIEIELLEKLLQPKSTEHSQSFSDYLSALNTTNAELSNSKKRNSSEVRFLKHVYNTLFAKYLKNYQSYSLLADALGEGNYDCLSSTVLFALVLEELGFEYQVFETSFHLFLMVKTEQKWILIEPTDSEYGFLVNKSSIKLRKKKYLSDNRVEEDEDTETFQTQLDIFQEVNLEQLAGLQFYNLAVLQYNQQQFQEALTSLQKASRLYPSPRGKELFTLTYNALGYNMTQVEE